MKEWIAVAVLLYSVPLFALLLTWKKPLWQALRGIVLSEVLGIPEDVFTPLFASARIAGWCATRIEEVVTCPRIMRPAYRAVIKRAHYDPIEARPSHYNFQL